VVIDKAELTVVILLLFLFFLAFFLVLT